MFPNYVIAGAPKCGTTSIFHWLSQHPEVCPSSRKEVQYFMDKDSSVFHPEDNYLDHGIKPYSKFFESYQEGKHKVTLEATPGYIYQKAALNAFSKDLKNTHLVFILREPVSRLYSNYKYFSQNRAELDQGISFTEFVQKIKNKSPEIQWNEFLKDGILHGAYMEYLSKWVAACGKERIHVLVYEDIAKDEKAFTINLAQRLGIDSSFYEDFEFKSQNKTVEIKNRLLHQIAGSMSNLIPFGGMRDNLRNFYFSLNGKIQKKEFDDKTEKTMQELKDYYKPYNESLSQKFKLNIDAWN